MNNPPIDTTGYALTISSGASNPREGSETAPKITQPTSDKALVRIDEVTSAQGRTLDDLYLRNNASTSSKSAGGLDQRFTVLSPADVEGLKRLERAEPVVKAVFKAYSFPADVLPVLLSGTTHVSSVAAQVDALLKRPEYLEKDIGEDTLKEAMEAFTMECSAELEPLREAALKRYDNDLEACIQSGMIAAAWIGPKKSMNYTLGMRTLIPGELMDKVLLYLFSTYILLNPSEFAKTTKALDLMMQECAASGHTATEAAVTAQELFEKIGFDGKGRDERNQRLLEGFLAKSRQYPAPIETAALMWLSMLVPYVGAPEGELSITGHLAPTARRTELLSRLVDRWGALPEEQLTLTNNNLKEAMRTILKNQCKLLPEEEKTGVLNRLDELHLLENVGTSSLHPIDDAGRSSPKFQHHENQRPMTVEEACEAIKAQAAKKEKEAIAVIDAFSDAFDKGMDDVITEVKIGTGKIHGSLDRLDSSMDRMNDNLKGLNQQLESYNNKLEDYGRRFNAGREKDRIVQQRILESMREETADYKRLATSTQRSAQILEESNKKTSDLLKQLKINREVNERKRGDRSHATTTSTSTETDKKSTAELLAQLHANREELERKRLEREGQQNQ